MNANFEMNLDNWNEMMKNASEEQRQEYTEFFAAMNAKNRNNERVQTFGERIINKENVKKDKYVKFLDSKSVNGAIYAPTQVGKSAATREFIETCFKNNVPVIVSTDNKTDQCEQLYTRILNDLSGADVVMMKVSDKKFEDTLEKCVKDKNNRFVIFCLDNAVQIKKLIRNIKSVGFDKGFENIKKVSIIHDEADTITKDREIENIYEEQAESRQRACGGVALQQAGELAE